jgi:PAS domain S-box-containing protein
MTPDAKLFQLAIEQTKDYAIFLLDATGHVMSWNLGARRMKGYAPEEIIGRHFSAFYTREAVDRGWPAHELRVAAMEGRFEDEGWRVRKDGSRFWANVIITALRDEDGKLVGFSKITRDVTDRKLHEEALAQSEERFRLLVEGVLDYAIYMLDPEGIITSWNLGAQRIKGYTAQEIIGKHFSRFFIQEDVEGGKPWEELATARRYGRCEVEGWRVTKTGSRFWARVVITALHDPTGRLRGFAKVTQDLSQKRYIQDLEAASKNVSEFVAVLAHELRNPLAPSMAAVQVIENTPAGHPAHEAMQKTIARQSAHLSRLVDDLLDISRVTRGELVIASERIELSDVARQAAETAAPAIENARHQLEMRFASQPVYVDGDAQRLAQLTANLLNNAARYTPPGGRITLTTRAEGAWGVLTVRDTGRGIEAEWLDRIFEMFVQGRPILERVGGGLGIGLALSRRIAELHGGSLRAFSEGADKGSEFTLRLPLAVAEVVTYEEHVAAPPAESPEDAASRRVLIVDDNHDAASTLEMLLQSLGHETRVVHSGVEALQAAPEFKPDVVLLDIGLPGIDGYEVARRLRSMTTERPFKIVAVTGWDQEADKRRSEEAGFDMHLVKPVAPADLEKALSERNGATLH